MQFDESEYYLTFGLLMGYRFRDESVYTGRLPLFNLSYGVMYRANQGPSVQVIAAQGRFDRQQCQNKLRRPRRSAGALFAAKAGMHSRFLVTLSPTETDNSRCIPSASLLFLISATLIRTLT